MTPPEPVVEACALRCGPQRALEGVQSLGEPSHIVEAPRQAGTGRRGFQRLATRDRLHGAEPALERRGRALGLAPLGERRPPPRPRGAPIGGGGPRGPGAPRLAGGKPPPRTGPAPPTPP